ncbi:uncharacterized protein [Centruroides vittatus]|uniref:uncharacterized protein n=1 Tax=Centruroides vittatus TaxID=120091 RepID=UPI00351035A8
MELLLHLFLFTFAFSPIVCWDDSAMRPDDPFSDEVRVIDRYCALSPEGKANIHLCFLENRIRIVTDIYKNCIQQQKFFQAIGEIDRYLCKIRQTSPELFARFIKCQTEAKYAASFDDPKLYPTDRKCFQQVRSRENKSASEISLDERFTGKLL